MKKILVPVDGSDASKRAAEKAIEASKIVNGELTFVYVVNSPDYAYSAYGVFMGDYPELIKSGEENGKKLMDSFLKKLNVESDAVKKIIITGHPYEEIVKIAEEGKYDLIVMGRKGYSKMKRFFVGSVTQRVIAESNCPVLVVMEQEKN